MQDATHTLSSRRGNAFDIASLEIALLRASDIPARYAVGTIEVEADRFRNWAGGFDDVRAAADYAASGGIATTSLVEGGRVAAVRMEHVWVEAAVDYLPSRAAVNRSADSWIPLDPSFKQYDFKEGIDVAAVTGIDPEQTAQSFLDSGTIDEQAGYVQGFDPTILQDTQADAETALEDHIANDLPDDATVRDVLGGRKIIGQDYDTLPASIPNTLVTTGVRFDALPEALQHRIAFGLGTTITGGLSDPVEFAWSELNGERVTLSFRPATQADEDALKSLLPEGEITDPSQLPDSIPSHLVDVIPELKVDGEVVRSGDAMALGAEMDFGFTVTQRGIGSDTAVSPVSAGSYLAVTVAGGSVAPARIEDAKARFDDTKSTLDSGDERQLASLTREEVLGELYHAGGLAYFGQLDMLGQLQAREQRAHQSLAPSAGTYGYTPKVVTMFGLPSSIEPGGVSMGLDRVARIQGADIDSPTGAGQRNVQLGALSSALEHRVPEQMFTTDAEPSEAISAVKALAIANAEGQRVYRITPNNQDDVLSRLQHGHKTMDEIRAALSSGKHVTTHTDPVSVPGWEGAGYVILDPKTGNGAWKIGGGLNGGLVSAAQSLQQGLSIFLDASKRVVDGDTMKRVLRHSGQNTWLGRLVTVVQSIGDGANLLGVSIDLLTAFIQGQVTSWVTAAIVSFFGGGAIVALVAAIVAFYLVTAVFKALRSKRETVDSKRFFV